MQKSLISFVLTVFALTTVTAQKPLKKVYNESINPIVQINNATKQAAKEKKFVICQVGGNWCPWCLRFADFAETDSTVNKMITDNYIYIHVNYNPRKSNNSDTSKEGSLLMKRLNNPQRFGFPVFVILDEKGNVMHIQDSSFLEEGKGYCKEKVLRFLKNWTPKAVNK